MRKSIFLFVSLVSFSAFSYDKHEETFQHLFGLAGQWQGKYPDGQTVDVDYKSISGGYALLEFWTMSANRTSITVYTIDEGKLNLTHYCPQGNQVRLVLNDKEWSQGNYKFDFVHASNNDNIDRSHLFNTHLSFISEQKFSRSEDYKLNRKVDEFDFGQKVIFTKINLKHELQQNL
ncbi:hypothetical protein [Alteromonas facilis]|uniref:hypothetical protein n=1 Tax=Alteromonas facilis TaxID=2048004 RepID=UPI000C28B3F4|nr:hypothetical protein [Alteromonas facilis]